MKVVVVCYEFPALSQTFVVEQIRQLRARGHQVHVIADAPGRPAAPVPEGVEVTYGLRPRQPVAAARAALSAVARLARRGRLGTAVRALDVRRWGRLATRLRTLSTAAAVGSPIDSDLVLCHFGPNGVLGSYLLREGLLTGRLAVIFHGYDLSAELRRRDARRAYRRLLRSEALLLPVSERLRRRLVMLGAAPERTRVLRMGVDPDQLGPPRRPGGPEVRLLTVARLTEKKGVEDGLRAASAAGRGRRLRYTIVGDGPLRAHLEAVAADLGDLDVRFLGARPNDEVRTLMAESDLLLAPSRTAASGDEEGIPVVLMEALASHLPVVATDHAGIPELVHHEVHGLLAPEGDVAALATAIGRLADDPDLRRRLGAAGRGRVEAEFDARAWAGELERAVSASGDGAP